MFTTIRHLLEMIRFSHTLFALPFALLAAAMAWTTPAPGGKAIEFGWRQLAGILLCMVAARSAAMAFNRILDRDVDAQNPRTKMRHLPAGTLSVTSAITFTLLASILFFAGALLFLPNWLPIALAAPVLAFLFGYSYTKRFTSLAHYWLGVALMLAPVCVWIALRGEILLANPADLLPALLLGLAVFTWVGGFDIIYACQDADFDREQQLHSIPARLGVPGALKLAAASHVATVLLLAALLWLCPQVHFGWIFGLGIAAVAMLLTYEHALVRPDDLTRVNLAFFNVNTIISVGLLLLGVVDLFWL
jgi:4-hydroxybenzoate polyprenyltransferase